VWFHTFQTVLHKDAGVFSKTYIVVVVAAASSFDTGVHMAARQWADDDRGLS
jgi:hypothetical protein